MYWSPQLFIWGLQYSQILYDVTDRLYGIQKKMINHDDELV